MEMVKIDVEVACKRDSLEDKERGGKKECCCVCGNVAVVEGESLLLRAEI